MKDEFTELYHFGKGEKPSARRLLLTSTAVFQCFGQDIKAWKEFGRRSLNHHRYNENCQLERAEVAQLRGQKAPPRTRSRARWSDPSPRSSVDEHSCREERGNLTLQRTTCPPRTSNLRHRARGPANGITHEGCARTRRRVGPSLPCRSPRGRTPPSKFRGRLGPQWRECLVVNSAE